MNQLLRLSFLLLTILCTSCQNDAGITPVIVRADATDFEEARQVSPTLAEGLKLDLWAPGPLIANAVALTFDHNGVAYVAETSRRKSSDIDIRAHRDWMTEELSLESLEDTRRFHREKLAPELSDQNTWLEDFNQDGIRDFRDLEVQTEYVRRIWDSDGDGRADASQLYAEGFNDMITGVAAGILSHNDDVFLTVAPDVWKLTDTNQDGIADERTKISTGYGIHIAYAGHDMSGLTMGPDGRIYWSIGDMGVNVVDENGKRWAYPHEGVVMRANPDGTGLEVFAHGLRNPQELAFDSFGNLISIDNDGDHPGEHERYVHIVEGSDSGWRINWQFGKYDQPNESYKVWMDEELYVPYFPGQAAYITPPLALAYDGPAGLAFNPGTALDANWKDYFFASFFTASSARSKVQAFKINPKGASFEIVDEKDVVGGIVPTGITFAADGALYINDWKDSYDLKPTGRIWRLDTQNEKKSAERTETSQLLQAGARGKSVTELRDLLAHADQRVRMMAQFELVRRSEKAPLGESAHNGANLLARLHGIWGIGQLARQDNSEVAASIVDLLADPEAEVRAQTAKVLGETNYQAVLDDLIEKLGDPARRVQFFAAEALGKLGDPAALVPLIDLLAKVDEPETHLRHGIVHALSRLDQADALAALTDHPSRQVRLGAVVALRKMQSPLLAGFLQDTDPLVLVETARAINDDLSIPEALPALAAVLNEINIASEAFIRRAINANLRLGDQASAQRLAQYAASPANPVEMRQDALWALGYWSAPPVLDRVDGRYRPLKGHVPPQAQAALNGVFTQLIKQQPELQAAAVTAAGRLNIKENGDQIFALLRNKGTADQVKIAAVTALAQMESPKLPAVLDMALIEPSIEVRTTAQELLSKVNLPAAELVGKYEKILNNNTVAEKQKAFASLSRIDAPAASALLQNWWEKFEADKVDPALQLDLLMAIEKSDFPELKSRKEAYETRLGDDVFAQYEVALYGGDPARGRRIFGRNETAQCIRCHVVGEYGGAVGPELTRIGAVLDRKDLLLSLVAPNARIAPGYGTVLLKLKDGQEIVGTLLAETTDDLQVKSGDAPPQTYAKRNIQEQELLPSGMFNMADVLKKDQIRDLVAFLVTLK